MRHPLILGPGEASGGADFEMLLRIYSGPIHSSIRSVRSWVLAWVTLGKLVEAGGRRPCNSDLWGCVRGGIQRSINKRNDSGEISGEGWARRPGIELWSHVGGVLKFPLQVSEW